MNKNCIEIKSKKYIGTQLLWRFRSVLLGHGIEFWDFREYTYWDDAKYIDWVASNKEQSLIMRRYQEDRDGVLNIIIDESESLFYEKNTLKNDLKNELINIISQASMYSGMKLIWWKLWEQNREMVYHKNIRIIQEKLLHAYSKALRSDTPLSLKKFVEKKQKSSIFVIISDSLDIEEKSLISLAKMHDVIYLHISSIFENSLQWNWLQSIYWKKRYFLNLDDEKSKEIYKKKRKEILEKFRKQLHSYKIRVWIFETWGDSIKELIKTLNINF